MSRDLPETVARLLTLAADGANEHEAAVAAVQAARLFKREKLTLRPDLAVDTCIMCQPATFVAVCQRCGHHGACPGHACANPEANSLCSRHASWLEVARRATARAPQTTSNFWGGGWNWVCRDDMPPHQAYPHVSFGETHAAQATIERLRQENAELRRALDEKNGRAVLLWPIEELALSPRTERALRAVGIARIGDLVRLTRKEVSAFRNVGKKAVHEMADALREHRLAFGMAIE